MYLENSLETAKRQIVDVFAHTIVHEQHNLYCYKTERKQLKCPSQIVYSVKIKVLRKTLTKAGRISQSSTPHADCIYRRTYILDITTIVTRTNIK
jgi:hypothetical protein